MPDANPGYKPFDDERDDRAIDEGVGELETDDSPHQMISNHFGDINIGDAYGNAFVELLLMLDKEFPSLHLKSGNDSAAVIPQYERTADVPDRQLAQEAGNDGIALVIADGELYRCTPD